MASEAVRGNMHMDTRVIKVPDFKSEVKWPPRSFGVIYLLGQLRSYSTTCPFLIALVDPGI